jgi:hypothetical protein
MQKIPPSQGGERQSQINKRNQLKPCYHVVEILIITRTPAVLSVTSFISEISWTSCSSAGIEDPEEGGRGV